VIIKIITGLCIGFFGGIFRAHERSDGTASFIGLLFFLFVASSFSYGIPYGMMALIEIAVGYMLGYRSLAAVGTHSNQTTEIQTLIDEILKEGYTAKEKKGSWLLKDIYRLEKYRYVCADKGELYQAIDMMKSNSFKQNWPTKYIPGKKIQLLIRSIYLLIFLGFIIFIAIIRSRSIS
jgi:hypothetical protein